MEKQSNGNAITRLFELLHEGSVNYAIANSGSVKGQTNEKNRDGQMVCIGFQAEFPVRQICYRIRGCPAELSLGLHNIGMYRIQNACGFSDEKGKLKLTCHIREERII